MVAAVLPSLRVGCDMEHPLTWTAPGLAPDEADHLRQILEGEYPRHSVAASLEDARRHHAKLMGREAQPARKTPQRATLFT